MGKGTTRRREILDEAARLFANQGVTATSVREIADRVGMLSGSLYHYFPSKDSMVEEIIVSYLDELLERYEAALDDERTPTQSLGELLRASLTTIEHHPHATVVYQNDAAYLLTLPRGEEIERRAERVPETWLGVIESGVAAGEFRSGIPPRVFYNMLRDALWRSVRWFDPTNEHTKEQLADDYLAVFLYGFAVPTAPR